MYFIITNMYNYIHILYTQLSLYWLNMNSNAKSGIRVQKKKHFKKCKPRSLLCRNAFSPYTEKEIKAIKSVNYIITDENRRSPLGKYVSYSYSPEIKLVEDGNFCSFIRHWRLVE